MNKIILSKITEPQGVLAVSDLTPDEKKTLYAMMQKLGSSENFAYKRFFQDGFSTWEIEGIFPLKAAYLNWLRTEEKIFLEVRCVGDSFVDGDDNVAMYRHFYRIPPKVGESETFEEFSFDINEPGDFWRFLGDIGYRQRFGNFMADRGMRSYHTVMKRFSDDDWREWEKTGIRQVTELFIEQYGG